MSVRPVILCILDGWGISTPKQSKYDAIKLANTPCWDSLLNEYPNSEISCSGLLVGLPEGQMGNSEVGHMTIGAGRIIEQDLVRINNLFKNKLYKNNDNFNKLLEFHKNQNKSVHLMGLCSDGGIHSHINHLLELIEIFKYNDIDIKLHLFLDGRDVSKISAMKYLNQIKHPISSICGRFYSMDRDKRYERTQKAFDTINYAKGTKVGSWPEYIEDQYQHNITDEFIEPAALFEYEGVKKGDSLFFFNFRSDRLIQLAEKFLNSNNLLTYKFSMTAYSDRFIEKIYPLVQEQIIHNHITEVLSNHKFKQLRIAETEKYAHVTYFFNGGIEKEYLVEDRILVPSPKVHTYDLSPEMSACEITDKLIESMLQEQYSFTVVNFANADMVGHCGKMEFAVKAVECIDQCLAKIVKKVIDYNYNLLITADHGNVECMYDEENKIDFTSHTTNNVPCVLVSNSFRKSKLNNGGLCDIAPTILKMLNIKQPTEMTGKSLLD